GPLYPSTVARPPAGTDPCGPENLKSLARHSLYPFGLFSGRPTFPDMDCQRVYDPNCTAASWSRFHSIGTDVLFTTTVSPFCGSWRTGGAGAFTRSQLVG